jgi:hypothetical protein
MRCKDRYIHNLNVRGRRGNIVQVYPSVEYDFVPNRLELWEGECVHFQWTGSDANPRGNAGNGRRMTDRTNIVEIAALGKNKPIARTSGPTRRLQQTECSNIATRSMCAHAPRPSHTMAARHPAHSRRRTATATAQSGPTSVGATNGSCASWPTSIRR